MPRSPTWACEEPVDLDDQHLQPDRQPAGGRYNLAFYLLAGFTIVSTVLFGRLYCGRVCAFGALTQLMDAVLPRRWRVNVPRVLERRAAWIKFGILGATLLHS